MGIFDVFRGGDTVRGALEGASNLAGGLRNAITGEEHQRKLRELEQKIQLAQLEVNKAESQHASVLVAGWRPALGWVIVLSIAYTFIARPVASAFGVEMPVVDTAALWPIILGMLGLAGYRTVEKSNGTQGRH